MDSITTSTATASSNGKTPSIKRDGSQKPPPLPIIERNIPQLLKIRKRWLGWRWTWNAKAGKWDKPPVDIVNGGNGSSTNPAAWCGFFEALEAYKAGKIDGLGFALGNGICGVDFDNCRDPETGEIAPDVLSYIRRLNTYCEVSPSGEGVKLFMRGSLPKGRRTNGNVEFYDGGRYFTVTSQLLDGCPSILADDDKVLAEVYAELIGAPEAAKEHGRESSLDDRALAIAALNGLSADRAANYEDWLMVGMALHAVDPELLGEFDAWSQKCPIKYTPGACAEKWASFNGSAVGLGSLIHWAMQDGWKPPRKKRARKTQPVVKRDSDLPEVPIPGKSATITETGERLGALLAATGKHYNRGGVPVRITGSVADPEFHSLDAAQLASEFETVATIVRPVMQDGEVVHDPAILTAPAANLVGSSQGFLGALPKVSIITRCPVLVEHDGQLVEIVGHDPRTEVYACGTPTENVPLDEACELLRSIIADFQFASVADRSRSLAALITPALIQGGLLPGRAPIDLGEADQSQTGKGFRNKLTAALYGCDAQVVAQRKNGVGSLEESFDRRLVKGASFIAIDNVRGRIDSPAIESFCTEDNYSARVPYSPPMDIDPRRIVLMFTSNKADITRDLANRSSCVRILKRDDGHQFASYPEGDILDHVRAHQPKFLGAVFAVVRAWHKAGKPRSGETRHDFRAWAQTLDWVVQSVLGEAPIMDGHRETQLRMAHPAMNWLREVVLLAARERPGDDLRTCDLLDLLEADGTIDIPGTGEGGLTDDNRDAALQHIGRKLGRCFGEADSLTIDRVRIERREVADINYRTRKVYVVSQVEPDDPPDKSAACRGVGVENAKIGGQGEGEKSPQNGDPPDNPADGPLMTPLNISRDPPTPHDSALQTYTRARTNNGAPSSGGSKGLSGGVGGIAGVDDPPADNQWGEL